MRRAHLLPGFTLVTFLCAAGSASAQEKQLGEGDPLAGFSGDTAYLRSADNSFVLMPHGRFQADGYFYKRDTHEMLNDTFLIKRARLEVFGWVGPWVGFQIGGDFAAGPPAAADPIPQTHSLVSDAYVVLAPLGDLAMLQVGEFNAPFMFENVQSDKYTDFIERAIAVRGFGFPSNKDMGAMVQGVAPKKIAHYAAGFFNGEGANFRNADNNFDFIGRVGVSPLAMADMPDFEWITLGASVQTGRRGVSGLAVPTQSTTGGLRFLDNKFTAPPAMAGGTGARGEMHQRGDTAHWALELDAPIMHKAGLRFEYVHKSQEFAESDITNTASGRLVELGHGKLSGYAYYLRASYWVLGDDRVLGRQGLGLPSRLRAKETEAPKHSVQVVARVERISETVTSDTPANANPNVGKTTLTSFAFGTNYWLGKRYRATFNYVLNKLGGDTKTLDATKKLVGGDTEHEFLFRLGIQL
jgi:phosphate-selective porin